MIVEKRQSSSRAVQGYTTGCSPAPEPPTSLGKALNSWKGWERGNEYEEVRRRGAPSESLRPVFLFPSLVSFGPQFSAGVLNLPNAATL